LQANRGRGAAAGALRARARLRGVGEAAQLMRERLILLLARRAAPVHGQAVRVRQLGVRPAQLQRQQVLPRARGCASQVRRAPQCAAPRRAEAYAR
jgi:hypothetical protein